MELVLPPAVEPVIEPLYSGRGRRRRVFDMVHIPLDQDLCTGMGLVGPIYWSDPQDPAIEQVDVIVGATRKGYVLKSGRLLVCKLPSYRRAVVTNASPSQRAKTLTSGYQRLARLLVYSRQHMTPDSFEAMCSRITAWLGDLKPGQTPQKDLATDIGLIDGLMTKVRQAGPAA